MKFSQLSLTFLLALSNASPLERRQDIDFSAYEAIPELSDVAAPVGDVVQSTATYDRTSVASAAAAAATAASELGSIAVLAKRDSACTAQKAGTGPAVTNPDTAAAFQSYTVFSDKANSVTTPPGYNKLYGNGLAAASDSTYLTYTILSAYDPTACATFCQGIQGCNSFNIFYERDPSMTPGPTCSNPASYTYIKCSAFGGLLTTSSAKNTGQWQADFQVVIAGSNIYVATVPAAISGFVGPQYYGNATIQAPVGYMGVQTFPQSQPYDPSVCAAACNQKSAYDIKQGLPSKANPDICNFFVAYVLYKNGQNGVFTCTYYTYAWDPSYATNVGQYDGQGNHFTIGYSNSYAVVGAPRNGVCTTYGASTVTPTSVTVIVSQTSIITADPTTTTAVQTTTTTTSTSTTTTSTILAKRTLDARGSTCVLSATTTTTLQAGTITVTSYITQTSTPVITTSTTTVTTETSITTTTTTTSNGPSAIPTSFLIKLASSSGSIIDGKYATFVNSGYSSNQLGIISGGYTDASIVKRFALDASNRLTVDSYIVSVDQNPATTDGVTRSLLRVGTLDDGLRWSYDGTYLTAQQSGGVLNTLYACPSNRYPYIGSSVPTGCNPLQIIVQAV